MSFNKPSKMLEEARSASEAVERQLFNLESRLIDLARDLRASPPDVAKPSPAAVLTMLQVTSPT